MADQTSFTVQGARVYRHNGDTDNPPIADLLVRDGLIEAINPPGEAPADRPVIKLDGHLIAPGFVNGHYHSHDVLAKGLFETMSLERWGLIAGPIGSDRPLEEVRLRTMLGAIECVRNGITTIQDFANIVPIDDATMDAIVGGYAAVGVRVVLGTAIRDRSQLDTILWADEMVDPAFHDLIGTYGGDGHAQLDALGKQIDRLGTTDDRLIWALAPSAPQRCSFDLLQACARFAKERNLPVYTHVYETRLQRLMGTEKYLDYGGSLIAFMEKAGLFGEGVTIAHGVWPDDDEIARIAASGTGVVLNMLSNLKLRSGVAPLTAYRKAKVRLSLGCDNCSCSDIQSIHQVMKLYCLLGGIDDPAPERPTAAEALRLGTLGGAQAAGREGKLGALEPGMAADFVAYDLSDPAWQPFNSAARQLVFAETGRGVREVFVGGRQIVKDGRCALVDEARVHADLETVMEGLRPTIAKLTADADKLEPAFQAIQARAFRTPMNYSRYIASRSARANG